MDQKFELSLIGLTNRLFPPPMDLADFMTPFSYQKNCELPTAESCLRLTNGDDLLNGIKLLDIGCGMGAADCLYVERGVNQVVGVDIDNFSLQAALSFRKKQTVEIAKRVTFVKGDVFSLPFSEESFDGAISITVFEHLSTPEVVLRELYRLLKPGGFCIIVYDFYRRRYGAHLFHFIHIPWPQIFFSQSALITFWNRASLEAQKKGGFMAFPPGFQLESGKYISFMGLNQLTQIEFEQILSHSGFDIEKTVPYAVEPLLKYNPVLERIPSLREYLAGGRQYLIKKR